MSAPIRTFREYGSHLARNVLPVGYRRIIQPDNGSDLTIETPQFIKDRDQHYKNIQDRRDELYPNRNYTSALARKYQLMNASGYHRPMRGTDVGSTMGSYNDVYKYVIFNDLFQLMTDNNASPITYINLFGNSLRYDISHSHTRGQGIDSAFYINKQLAAAGSRDIRYRRDTIFTQLLKQCRLVNGTDTYTREHNNRIYGFNTEFQYSSNDCSERSILNKFQSLPRLDNDFRYFPGYLPIVRSLMRSHDRVVVMESDQSYYNEIKQFIGNDRRFNIMHMNPYYRGPADDNERTELLRQIQDPDQPDITLQSEAQFVDSRGQPIQPDTAQSSEINMPDRSTMDTITDSLKQLYLNNVFDLPNEPALSATEIQYFIDQLESTDLSHLGEVDRLLSDWIYDQHDQLHRAIIAAQQHDADADVDVDPLDDVYDIVNINSIENTNDTNNTTDVDQGNDHNEHDNNEYMSAEESLKELIDQQKQLNEFIDKYMPSIISSEEYKFSNDAELQSVLDQQSIPRTQPTYHQYYDAVKSISKPLTAHQFIHFDIDQHESYDSVLYKLEQIQDTLMPELLKSMPTAQMLLTYPIYGRNYPDTLLSSILSCGVNSVLHSYYFPRIITNPFDNDISGTGVVIVNPPLYYENYLKQAQEYMDLMVDGAQYVDELHGVANRHPLVESMRRKYYVDTDHELHQQITRELDDSYYRPARPSVTYLTEKDTSYDNNNPDRFNDRYVLPDFSPIGGASLHALAEKQAKLGRRTGKPLDYDDRTTEEYMSQLGKQPTWRMFDQALPHIPGVKRRTKVNLNKATHNKQPQNKSNRQKQQAHTKQSN